MIQDKNKPELPGHISIRTSGIFSTFHLDFLGRWGAWIVLLASLLITFNAWYFARGEATQRAQARFDFRVKTIVTGIYERLHAYEFLLRGGSSLFAASDEVTRKEWRTYVAMLQINQYYPGIQGVGFSKRILPSEKAAHLRQIRGEGFPQYTIKPDGERPEYTSIIFLEPFDWRNQRAFGYDMFSEPTRKEAMIRARDIGIAALSGKVTLVQETVKDIQAGFLIYLAVYRKGEPRETPEQRRKALMGYVYSPFRMNDFMKGILVEKGGYVELQIFDGDKPLKETMLYRSDTAHSHPEGRHFATHQSILEYAGHRWLLSFVSSKHFEENIEIGFTHFILLFGITISLLLFGMVLSLIRSRNQAIALANTTFELEKTAEVEQRLRHEIELLLRAFESFTSSLNTTEISDHLCRYVEDATHGHYVTVYLRQEEWLQVVSRTDGTSGSLIERNAAASSKKLIRFQELTDPVVIENVRQGKNFHNFRFYIDTCSAMIIPFSFQRCIIGYLTVENRKEGGIFEDAELRIAKALANEAAIALESAMLFQQVKKLSTTDPLTGAYNRRYFYEAARKLIKLSFRHKRSLSALMLDIDYFKKVNDTYGHDAGDDVLKRVAQTCQRLMRATDLSARYGGEEFCFLFPETNASEALIIAEKLRTAIAELEMEANGQKFSITASLGVSECDNNQDSLESLIKRSDEALYEAKRKGRNCAVIWSL